jgi:F-type H+-transporting ATPase subunit b
MSLLADSTFWVAIGLVLFIAIVVYFKAPQFVTAKLDERSERIAKELEEARRLREEAQAMLASFQRKQREAEKEAESIIAQARAEADRMAKEAHAQMEAHVSRRTRLAEERIQQAEIQAMNEVRALAAEIAIAAATRLITERMSDKHDSALIDATIADVEAKLH